MKKAKGKCRVVIENVKPQINCGAYPVKRVVGETVRVTADLIGDGHDIVNGEILFKHASDKQWSAAPMSNPAEDHWQGQFTVSKKGEYLYTVRSWIDHPQTWQHDVDRKLSAGQHIGVELASGADWLKRIARFAKPKEQAYLKNTAKLFVDEKQYSKAVSQAMSDRLLALIKMYPLKDNASQYPKKLSVSVDTVASLYNAWYEFFPRSASSEAGGHGTFRDCEKVLPIIARMGFDVVYFPPIHPIGVSFRKGKNNATKAEPGEPGSPWAIGSSEGGHKSIHKELGTLDDFHHLVKTATAHQIEVALDLAFQCSPDHPYVKDHPEWFKWRADGSVQYAENPPKKYQDVLPLNFESNDWQALWEELKSIVTYWIDQGVSIFRVDNPHTKPFAFWEWLIAEVRKDHPDVIFLAEAFTRQIVMSRLAKIGFTQSYTYFSWKEHKHELVEYMNQLTQSELREYFRPNFWPNTPDINPYYLQNTGFNASAIRFILAATLSSSYGMYGPVFDFLENQPIPNKEEYLHSEKYEIRKWDWPKWTPFRALIAKVNRIRKENPAFHNTFNTVMCPSDNDQMISYFKATENLSNILYIVVNLDPHNTQRCMTRLPVERLNMPARRTIMVHDLLTDQKYHWSGEWNYIELRPDEAVAHIFRLTVIDEIS